MVSAEDYEYFSVQASAGIDPTWDAGVVLIEDDGQTPPPGDPESPTPSGEPSDPAGPPESGDETPGDTDGELSKTGASLALTFGALGLVLLAIGGTLYARHRKGSEA